MVLVTTYDKLEQWFQRWLDGSIRLLIVESRAGLGKTHTISAMLQDAKALMLQGHLTPLSFYQSLYRHQETELTVLDDITNLMNNRLNTGLLMSLCDTSELRTVSWQSTTKALGDVPKSFDISSRVCILVNRTEAQNPYIKPIIDRSVHVDFKPSRREIVGRMQQVTMSYPHLQPSQKEQVLNVMETNIQHIKEPSLRMLIKGFWLFQDFLKTGKAWLPDYMRMLDISPELVKLQQLQTLYKTDKERIEVWVKSSDGWKGSSERTYWRYKTKVCRHS